MKITDITSSIRLAEVSRRLAATVIFAIAVSIPTRAITLDEAREAFGRGDYAEAVDELKAAATKEPKNQTLNQMAGIALMYTGNPKQAVTFLKRGTNDANLYLAEIALRTYNLDGAEEYLATYDEGLGKGKRKKAPSPRVAELENEIERTRSMLDRVAAIEIIDSLTVNRDDFFRHYNITPSAGRLEGSESLPKDTPMAENVVVYVTENGRSKIWAAPDENENYTLVRSTMLDDGSWEAPHPLGNILNEGGDANYPFLMSDGVTLYFANDGENSLGGYDIFIASDNDGEYLQPQNMGMPFNSPYDDYMLAIDEETGIGWWATDRNRLDDEITIYKFIPQEFRKNYPPGTPHLASLAMASNIKATWQPGKDYARILQEADAAVRRSDSHEREFEFALPGGRIYHRLSDFKSEKARRQMKEYLSALEEIASLEQRLAKMRSAWRQGDHRNATQIKALERNIVEKKAGLTRLSNAVVRSEN